MTQQVANVSIDNWEERIDSGKLTVQKLSTGDFFVTEKRYDSVTGEETTPNAVRITISQIKSEITNIDSQISALNERKAAIQVVIDSLNAVE